LFTSIFHTQSVGDQNTNNRSRKFKAFVLVVASASLVLGASTPAVAAACGSGSSPSVGDGTVGAPYQISTADHLKWLSATSAAWSNKHYIQTANIDIGGCDFNPIAEDDTITGSYDGKGFTISNLTISSDAHSVGLFSASYGPFTLKNLGIINAAVVSNWPSPGGGEVGIAFGDMNNFSGNISISGVFTSGSVRASIANNYAGGLVGYVNMRGQSKGASITNSYSVASVQNNTIGPGGLIGNYTGVVSENVTLSNVYSAGTLTVVDTLRSRYGLVGNMTNGTHKPVITNSFWDTDITGALAVAPFTIAGSTAKSTSEMKSLTTFSAWPIVEGWEAFNFSTPTNFWGICSSVNDGYPFLLWEYVSNPCVSPASPSSSAAAPSLATTGTTSSNYLALVPLLLAVGALLVWFGRVRRSKSEPQ
jgi:hypothetical protein